MTKYDRNYCPTALGTNETVEQRGKALLPSTKAIYQAFIDAIDKITEQMGEEK